MELILAALVGLLVAAGAYLMMSGYLVRFLFGLVLLSNAANLAIFAAGRLTYAAPPLIPEGALAPGGPVGNALPQALILTAIVIGFGLFAFALALSFRAYNALGTAEMNAMRHAEPVPAPTPTAAAETERPA
ncbi:Na+/H+ antiporter subunit C [Roseospira goensis]|uniref:Multicomponent Na+:H+ antiporter subunit C n=1 Tax=Roseospira goensis TaxID=391922 RepID=A0A7W6WK20_9PROT|nr:Na+/H+ antiporter subunit C [Roseospira goensis]MBB4285088.1 multicomponent Na+:H+ antiporter subunit C [Roseospira goensis]